MSASLSEPATPHLTGKASNNGFSLPGFGSSKQRVRDTFYELSATDVLPSPSQGGKRFVSSKQLQITSSGEVAQSVMTSPIKRRVAHNLTFVKIHEGLAQVEASPVGRPIKRNASNPPRHSFTLEGSSIEMPGSRADASFARQSFQLYTSPESSFAASFSIGHSPSGSPKFGQCAIVDPVAGIFMVRPGGRPATSIKPLLRMLRDDGRSPSSSLLAQGVRAARAVKAGATLAPGPAFYNVPQQSMQPSKPSFNQNQSGRYM
jgi:hypothetical protein